MPFDAAGSHVASNTGLVSTTWTWKRVKIEPAARPRSRQPAEPASGSARDYRRPAHFSLKFRGGPECWYEVQTGGRTFRYPGWMAIHDVVENIARGRSYHRASTD